MEPIIAPDATTPPQPVVMTATMLDAVKATGPWLRFFSIMCFIGTGFGVLAGLGMFATGMFGAAFSEEIGGGVLVAAMGGLYLIFALVYVFPGVFLFRAAGGVVQMKRGQVVAGLEKALANQKSLWKFMGIVTVVMLCLYPLFIVAAVLIPVLANLG